MENSMNINWGDELMEKQEKTLKNQHSLKMEYYIF